jgi:DNA-binding NarL/FixJ family response regulator
VGHEQESAIVASSNDGWRNAMALLLSEEGGFHKVLHAPDVNQLRQSLDGSVSMVVVGVFPNLNGFEDYQRVRAACPKAKLIAFSHREGRHDILAAFAAGMDGYIPSNYSRAQVLSAVRRVREGYIHLPPMIAEIEGAPDSFESRVLSLGLRGRAAQVLGLMCKGLSNRQIASELGVTEGTASEHVSRVLSLLGVRNRMEAVSLVLKDAPWLRG